MATAQQASKHYSDLYDSLDAKALRIRLGVSIDSICERTKISRYFLEAIEERAYHRLPGGVFDINYIRQYSEFVGCSADILLADYQTSARSSVPDNSNSPSRTLPRRWWRSLLTFFYA